MATNLEVLGDALRSIGVVGDTEEPTAEMADHALRILNDMMEEWRGDGVDVGQWPQTDPQETFPGDIGIIQTVKASLAVALAPAYERDVRPATALAAEKGYRRLLRDALVANMPEADMSHLPLGAGYGEAFDIERG